MGGDEAREKRMKRRKMTQQDSWGRAAPLKGALSQDTQSRPQNSWRGTAPGEGPQKEWLCPRRVTGFHDHVVETQHPSVVETFHPGSNHPPILKRPGTDTVTQILRTFPLLFTLFWDSQSVLFPKQYDNIYNCMCVC